MEEIDMCWRLKNQGFQIYCYPQSTVYHLGGGTLSAQSPQKTYLNFRNNLVMIIKNDYRKGFLFLLFRRMILDGAALIKMLFTQDYKHAIAVLRAHICLYSTMPSLIKDRKYWREKKTVYNRTGFYQRSVVFDFYLRKKKEFKALSDKDFATQERKR